MKNKDAYEQGRYDGWHRIQTSDQRFNIGPLAVSYADGYRDGFNAENSAPNTGVKRCPTCFVDHSPSDHPPICSDCGKPAVSFGGSRYLCLECMNASTTIHIGGGYDNHKEI